MDLRSNKIFLIGVIVFCVIMLGVLWLTIQDGRRLLGKTDDSGVVYSGHTEDRPHE